jgi:hypothetical protein
VGGILIVFTYFIFFSHDFENSMKKNNILGMGFILFFFLKIYFSLVFKNLFFFTPQAILTIEPRFIFKVCGEIGFGPIICLTLIIL